MLPLALWVATIMVIPAAPLLSSVPPPCPRGADGYDLAAMNCAAPGPVAPPKNGTILACFCGGDCEGDGSTTPRLPDSPPQGISAVNIRDSKVCGPWMAAFSPEAREAKVWGEGKPWGERDKGKCGGGMGNWWSPSIVVLDGGVVVVTALGKSATSIAHSTPTFMQAFRSTDHGRTFRPPTTLLPEDGRVYVGGSLAYSASTHHLNFVWTHVNNSGCTPACGVGNLSRLVSSDEGASWTDAGQLRGADGRRIISDGQVNSGLKKRHAPFEGRLVLTRELSFGAERPVFPTPRGFKNTAGVVYSDDDGAQWSAGAPMPPPFSEGEAAVAELSNGSLVISARNGQNRSDHRSCAHEPCRVFARSDDGGASWGHMWHVPYDALPAGDCEAAMAHAELPGHAIGALIIGFNMNTTTDDRTNYTLHTSLDGGETWQWASGVYPFWAGYSALGVLGPAQRVGERSWRVDVGAAFQLGHNLGSHVETGGADLGWARRALEISVENGEKKD